MKFFNKLYLSHDYSNRKEELIDKLEHNKVEMETYLVVLSQSEKNHLDVFHAVHLKQGIFERIDLFVVGIAKGQMEAYELVEIIVRDVYNETGATDIKEYILKCQKEYEEGNYIRCC